MHLHRLDEANVNHELQALIGDTLYPCNAARGVLARSNIELCVVDRMTSREAAATVQARLEGFSKQPPSQELVSFIVTFSDQPIYCEGHYDALFWSFLQQLHDVDATLHPWDEQVSRDPNDPEFSFSVGGEAYYLIGLHPHSSRKARRFLVPAIVFNLHRQFEALRRGGKYTRLRDTIRSNDVRYSGSVNPMLQDFGAASETVQYSGQQHEEGWRCPLQTRAR